MPQRLLKTVSVTSSQTNDALSTNDNSETASEDVSANPPTLSEAVENTTAKTYDGLGQL